MMDAGVSPTCDSIIVMRKGWRAESDRKLLRGMSMCSCITGKMNRRNELDRT